MIEDAVFLRSSLCGGGRGGDADDSFEDDVFRDNQENGLVKLLLAAIGVGVGVGPGDTCGCSVVGGGPHGTEGRTPDKPCKEGLEFLAGRGGLVVSGTRIIRLEMPARD
jgi:hypothetical protein